MRFAILRHVTGPDHHFDLLFEDSSGWLRTWRSPAWPRASWGAALELQPHRSVYLLHQGPIVGKGWVKRVERGTFRPLANRADVFRVLVESANLNGVLEFVREPRCEKEWRFRRASWSG